MELAKKNTHHRLLFRLLGERPWLFDSVKRRHSTRCLLRCRGEAQGLPGLAPRPRAPGLQGWGGGEKFTSHVNSNLVDSFACNYNSNEILLVTSKALVTSSFRLQRSASDLIGFRLLGCERPRQLRGGGRFIQIRFQMSSASGDFTRNLRNSASTVYPHIADCSEVMGRAPSL